MRILLALLALSPLSAEPLAPTPTGKSIQRYLASLRLGDTLKEIESVYPPTKKWSKYTEPGGRVVRINLERGFSKWFPAKIDTIRLGLKYGRLVHVQLVYDKEYTRRKPLSELVVDFSLMYGEPRRDGETYFWWDGDTVVAASQAEVPTEKGAELRTSLELMDSDYFEPLNR